MSLNIFINILKNNILDYNVLENVILKNVKWFCETNAFLIKIVIQTELKYRNFLLLLLYKIVCWERKEKKIKKFYPNYIIRVKVN